MPKKMRTGGCFFFAVLLVAVLGYFLARPLLVVENGQGMIYVGEARTGQPIRIRFIHSVQKTPVEEDLRVDERVEGFVLEATRYQSFGVGLPFLENEGRFHAEGDYFVLEDMGRRFPRLSLRTGVGTELVLTVDGEEKRLYESLAPGSRIDIYIAPVWRWGMKKLLGETVQENLPGPIGKE